MTGPDGRQGFTLGVDLGTSHTVAMLRRPDGRTRPLLFDGQPLLPSAVYLDAAGSLHVGRDALRLGHAEPGRFEPHPKRHIDAGTVLLGSVAVPVADLLAALLGAVAREAVATTGFLPPAVLTFPAAWGAARRDVLTEAIAKAGWPPGTGLLPEPVAAARYFADVLRRPVPVGKALAVFDFGGGTLDIAVVRNEGFDADGHPRFAVAASGGADDLGGLDVDAAVVDHLGASLATAESAAWQALTDPVTLAQWRARRQFWDDVRGAKEMLSRAALAPVPVPGVEHAVHLTRDELEAAAGPLIRRGVAEAATVIKAAGSSPDELAGLFLVGGSSRVPLVARLLHAELGISPTVLEQPELPVAEGAIVAFAQAAAGSVDAPVTPTAIDPMPVASRKDSQVRYRPGVAALAPPTADTVLDHPSGAGPADHSPQPADTAIDHPAGPNDTALDQPAARADTAVDQSPPRSDARSASGPPPAPLPPPPDFLARGAAPAATPSSGLGATPGAAPAPPRAGAAPGAEGWAEAGSATPGEPEPQYAEPVDPWATGEAAAFGGSPLFPGSGAPVGHPMSPASDGHQVPPPLSGHPVSPPHGGHPVSPSAGGHPVSPGAGSWLASTHPEPGPAGAAPATAGRTTAYRNKVVWLVAAAVVVVVGVATTLAVVFWPGNRALDFQALSGSSPVRLAPVSPLSSGLTDTAVFGDRAYFAGASADGELGIIAAETGTGKELWRSTAAGNAPRWAALLAVRTGPVVFTDTDSGTGKKRMAVLDGDSGELLWHRTIDADDHVLFVADVAVLVDRAEKRVLGLELDNRGRIRWEEPDPEGGSSAVIPVTTVADVSGPANPYGGPFAPVPDDDKRIVQLLRDGKARVLDATNGKVLAESRHAVADTSDDAIAHNGRLIVREGGTPQHIRAYDLKEFGEPRVLHTVPADADNTRIEHLTPCDADRICWVERIGYDADNTRVGSVNVAEGGGLWHRELPSVDILAPVGDSVLAVQNGAKDQVSLLDAKGEIAWTRDGAAARLDAGNLLLFSKAPSTSPHDPALAGLHVGDEQVQLGPLDGVRSATCSWNTSVIACVAEEDFLLQRFAG